MECVSLFIFDASKEIEFASLQMFCAVEQIRQIKITDIISCDNIWINFSYEIGPFLHVKKLIKKIFY